ncbi:MAG TPA: DNA-processing protein DprA [Trueperaceae bacterium]
MKLRRAARLLALLGLPGVGARAVWDEYGRARSVEGAWSAIAARRGAAPLLADALPACEAAVAAAVESGLEVLTFQDDGYPPLLKDALLPPPPVLFVRGSLPRQLLAPDLFGLASAGVVGTRKATADGLAEARYLGSALAAAGAVVVSGLALGIDGAAHRGALDARRADPRAAPTVAVLGGAHDRLHPKAHEALAEAIVAGGGAVVSEHPPGTHPQPHLFLHRNRVIAGLSRVLVVVEAGERSGALNTADHAARIGRDVLTVPARPTDRRRAGNLGLLRGGAKVLVDTSDLAAHVWSPESVAAALEAMAAGGRRARDGEGAAKPRSGVDPRDAAPPGPFPDAPSPRRAATGSDREDADAPAPPRPPGHGCLRVLAVLARDGDASFDGLLARLTRSGVRRRPTPAELAGCLVRLEVAGCLTKGDDGRYRATALAGRPAPRQG